MALESQPRSAPLPRSTGGVFGPEGSVLALLLISLVTIGALVLAHLTGRFAVPHGSQPEVLARRRGERLQRPKVTVDEQSEVLVSGLGRFPVEWATGHAAAISCPARSERAVMRATTCPDSASRLTELPQIRVTSAGCLTSNGLLRSHGCPGVGACVLSVSDGDDLAVAD